MNCIFAIIYVLFSMSRLGKTAMQHQEKNRIIAENIWIHRVRLGMTRKQLAKRISDIQKIDFSYATLRNYEKGNYTIPAVQLNMISSALSVPLSKFFESSCYTDLMDSRRLQLIELFNTTKTQGLQDALICIMRYLARK